ncbi:MAG: LytTR family DNA-binding domain-containing protein [Devosia sp.]
MNDSALQSTLRETQRHLLNPKSLGTMGVIAIVLGLAGPFGTFDLLPMLQRLAYWVAVVFLTYAAGYGLSMFADALWGRGRSFWQRLAIMSLPAGAGATLIVSTINLITFGTANFSLGGALVLLGQSFAVAIGVVAIVLLLEPKSAAVAAGPPAILERVPPAQRGTLLALIVEDHYVDIVTDRGKTLVLMRLADAMRETGPLKGLQIHRSHWVAREVVVKAHRAEGKVLVELSNGLRLPVSRGYLAAAREAGLI